MSATRQRRHSRLAAAARYIAVPAVPAAVVLFAVPAPGSHPGAAGTAAALGGCLLAAVARRVLRPGTRGRRDAPAGSLSEPAGQGYGATPEVLTLVEQGRKIQAIKRYRQLNPGTGLKEAKDVIDALAGRDQLLDRAKARW